ncbi:type II toxin-antitoxin system RelE/ParE family toxin [Erwinia billingiae]|uniref:type II toxin-antitoxin system RelE/ParE family toxin n=1 Tax=Erwinia billingiae TaxID=182337 RepID=UPI002AF6A64B|nr:type II toxin-antitoxin system RelE/ParE family toxin [Erwinia billingiae]
MSFLDQIASQCVKLAEAPERYRLWKELAENIRLCPFRQYLIVFSVQDKQVRIERVLHCARDIKNLVGSSE